MTLAEARKRHAWLVKRARTMRANPTDAERKLWYLLKQRRLMELRWRRQQIIDDRYIVDFICFEHRLIVEADGSQHSDNKDDAVRDGYLKEQGFHVLRFWNNDILSNVEGVGETVLGVVEHIGSQTRADPTPNPLPQGERAFNDGANL